MKTPSFWYKNTSSFASVILIPLAKLYASGAKFHRTHKTPLPVASPVICLGNLVAGGSGKTPTAIAVMKLIQDNHLFLSPAFVTRGYKGKVKSAERVDDSNDASLWGDEAILLARHAPTYVSPNRYEGADHAVFNGADAILLDDGLQNYDLKKDISFAVIDGMMGFGNEQVIPSGPLRQPLADGFAIADAFILIGDDINGVLGKLPTDKPVFRAKLHVREPLDLPHTPYIAFCGIGFPDKFRATLEAQKIDCVAFHAYADHHHFTIDDMTKLVDEALEKKARLLTTEKDFVRLPDFTKKSLIDVLPIEITFENPDTLIGFIRSHTNTSSTT